MKKITLLTLGLMLAVSSFAQTTWTMDKGHSQLNFSVTHLTISTISGAFRTVSATLTTSKDDYSDASVELTAETGSVSTGVDMRDNHLKTADFFDAATYPTLTFKSVSFKNVSGNNYQVTGNLTFHGVTKLVTLNAVLNGTVENPMSHKTTAGWHISGTIKRSDFGIGNKFPEAVVSDNVTLDANTEFTKG
jgi:polyisoprenoid-binding protein YceI